jgi:oxepin-CoA hydrolase/3-oxo-5,6-dehydrosuberyl-CoA semialdehyde dehydrogenase
LIKLESYVLGAWQQTARSVAEIRSAVNSAPVAVVESGDVNMASVLAYGRKAGAALRSLTFHQRASLLKQLAQHLSEHKSELYDLSLLSGARRSDAMIDIDGGIGTLFAYAAKGRRELPNSRFLLDGDAEAISKKGTFVGRHIKTPLQGAAIHINAFNFPCWGLLEKFAPAFLAGMPVVAKPATVTAYVAHAMMRQIVLSAIVPEGALQFIVGDLGDTFDHLTCQDLVAFTGSAATSEKLQNHPAIARNAVRFIAERDSLNAAILGPDADVGSIEFDLFAKEVVREMTVKAGQKCTAIRRIFVPSGRLEHVISELQTRLERIRTGDPAREDVGMGPLVGLSQRDDVLRQIAKLRNEASIVCGDLERFEALGADAGKGAFLPPILLHCTDPRGAVEFHATEAFGPVATIAGYDGIDDAIELTCRGEGSLVASLFTHDDAIARDAVFGIAPYHGRILIADRDCAAESTGHGSPLPYLVHGGPGRAGGGQELGGIRGLEHYMQRSALQASPKLMASLTGSWIKGAPEVMREKHPFRYAYNDLVLGQAFHSKSREVSLDDIEHFAHFTRDTFYAHMSEEATRGHPFFPGRVAHGYLLLAFAAGLFVDPDPGPVLANYGLDTLRFLKPVQPGESIKVSLTAKEKNPRNSQYGEVRWSVEIQTGSGEVAATYELLTMNTMTS